MDGASARKFSTRLYRKLWEPVTNTALKIVVQLCCNYELVMSLTSATQYSYIITMPIIDDDIVRMCPSDIIGLDSIGKKVVRLG